MSLIAASSNTGALRFRVFVVRAVARAPRDPVTTVKEARIVDETPAVSPCDGAQTRQAERELAAGGSMRRRDHADGG